MRELKLRGLVRRTLVVAPKSQAMQVAEMDTHFNESFSLINPGDLDVLERLEGPSQYINGKSNYIHNYNPWKRFPQAIVTLDAVKPLTRHRGGSNEKNQAYNQNRYEKLIQGQWCLTVVDESQRIGSSNDKVVRYS